MSPLSWGQQYCTPLWWKRDPTLRVLVTSYSMSQFESIKKMMPLKMVFSSKNFFFRHDQVFWRQWLRKLTVWKVNYSPPVFSFLLPLTERLLIAWLRINKNSWYTKTVSFGEEYERSKMITSGKIEHSVECCFSILLKLFQRVKRLNSSIFWKTVLGEAFLSCIRLVNS